VQWKQLLPLALRYPEKEEGIEELAKLPQQEPFLEEAEPTGEPVKLPLLGEEPIMKPLPEEVQAREEVKQTRQVRKPRQKELLQEVMEVKPLLQQQKLLQAEKQVKPRQPLQSRAKEELIKDLVKLLRQPEEDPVDQLRVVQL
jgi:hypothetical protein